MEIESEFQQKVELSRPTDNKKRREERKRWRESNLGVGNNSKMALNSPPSSYLPPVITVSTWVTCPQPTEYDNIERIPLLWLGYKRCNFHCIRLPLVGFKNNKWVMKRLMWQRMEGSLQQKVSKELRTLVQPPLRNWISSKYICHLGNRYFPISAFRWDHTSCH